MRAALLLLVLLPAFGAASVGGQDLPPAPPSASPPIASPAASAYPTAASVSDTSPPPPTSRHSWPHVVLFGAGGALVGGWAGFMASQIAWSDWSEGPGRSAQRVRFSVAGAVVGLVAGTLLGRRPSSESAAPATAFNPGRAPVTKADIRASSARTLTDLLRELRPQWLRNPGVTVLLENGVPVTRGGVRVYLDGALLGGIDTLDEVAIDAVTSVEFLDAGAATLKWGAGNTDGAILISTASR